MKMAITVLIVLTLAAATMAAGVGQVVTQVQTRVEKAVR